MTAALLEVRGLVKRFPARRSWLGRVTAELKAVDGIDLAIRPGEVLGLVGESGCGKSTTGRLMLRLIEPTAGQIFYKGQDLTTLPPEALRRLRRHFQIIFQDPFASLNPRMTVAETLDEPLMLHGWGDGAARRGRIADLLQAVGLPPRAGARLPHEFSGGQRQRIGIARALAAEPELIVCDEAVSALDVSIQAQVLNLLQDLRQRLGIALVFISHNLAVVRHIADRVAVMYLGRIIEIGPTDQLFAAPRHPYTQALLAAVPAPELRGEARPALLAGDVPNAIIPPAGCHFHPRCSFVQAQCRVDSPALRGEDHRVACHLADQIPRPADPATHPETDAVRRLRRLQQAFLTNRPNEKDPG